MPDSPRDNEAYRFPVSVKGIVIRDDAVVLVRNRRDEWELPGGKLEIGETPEQCVAREVEEELQLDVEPATLVDSWVYAITPDVHVLVISYGCVERARRTAVVSPEHTRFAWVALADVAGLRMPHGYKTSIVRWASMAASATRADAQRA